jgi:glycosyltransferase involved in cell wall biosynthesis
MVTYVNGKFTAQPMTGVQRVATQLTLALDGQVDGRWVLLCPPGAVMLPLRRLEQRVVGTPGRALHAWEQWTLPRAARDGLLLSLAGSAPFFARRQCALLHDAAVFDHPRAYTATFVAWYRCLFRVLAHRAERLFTVSEFSSRRLADFLGGPPSRYTVLHNGADHLGSVVPDAAVLARRGLRDRHYLLAVASANPTKNLAVLVAAYAQMPAERRVPLVIVGGGNPHVFAAVADPGDPPGVQRTGRLSDAELKALYESATALVLPSIYEGFGLPALEAMACGCPVIAARAAALPEVCGEAALYVDPGQTAEITAAMVALVSDAALRDRLRRAGLERAASFRWADAAQRLLAALGSGEVP